MKTERPSRHPLGNPEKLRAADRGYDSENNGSNPRIGGRIELAGFESASFPMIVSRARLGANSVTTRRVSERSASLEKNADLSHAIAERDDHEDRRDDLQEKSESGDH